MSNIATIHCCPFKDNNAHLQFSLKMNNVKLAEFSEPVFQLSLASLKCLGILVLVTTILSVILDTFLDFFGAVAKATMMKPAKGCRTTCPNIEANELSIF